MHGENDDATLHASAAAFKIAMRRLASTISIISACAGGRPFGMTATAVTSVTAEPPTLLICVNKRASIHDPILGAGRFCVNLLGPNHADLVPVFSGKVGGASRFAYGAWSAEDDGLPYLADAMASFSCATRQTVTAGTHTIFIGEVATVRVSGEAEPLLYGHGALAVARRLDPFG